MIEIVGERKADQLQYEVKLRSFSKDVCVGRVMGMWVFLAGFAAKCSCMYVSDLFCVCSTLCVFVLSVPVKEDSEE